MKAVGHCPCCGNPIYGKRKSAGRAVQEPLRTCFCVPLNAKPIQTAYIKSPTITGSANTMPGITITSQTLAHPKPPDEDGALVA